MIADFFIVVEVMVGWVGSFMGMFRGIEVEVHSCVVTTYIRGYGIA